jgi:uncharacterized damage-inducible protein DinB
MSINELLLPEFDEEIKKTRTTLERVPQNPDFAPHAKSMPLGKLAPHIAQLAGFAVSILTTPQLDFSSSNYTPLPFESAQQLVGALDKNAAQARQVLREATDDIWQQSWQLLFGGKLIFTGSRFLAYRELFLNHLVHHRAQLGVYLRLCGLPVPATYGPSADETLGF